MDWSDVDDLPAPDGVDVESWRDAVDAARDYCGWHLAPTVDQTLILDGPGGWFLPLPSMKVLSVSVIEDGKPLQLDGDYVLSRQSWGLIRTRGCWSCKPASIKVDLEHGYATLPRAVRAVALSLVDGAAAYGSVQAGPFSIRAPESAQAGTAGLNDYQANALAPHRLPGLP